MPKSGLHIRCMVSLLFSNALFGCRGDKVNFGNIFATKESAETSFGFKVIK